MAQSGNIFSQRVMQSHSRLRLCIVVACLLASSASLAAGKTEPLYEVVLDMDRDGKMERAVLVLVGPGRTDFHELTKERYWLSEDERVDLLIFLGAGDAALDLTREPAIRKESAVGGESYPWVLPLEAGANGALKLWSSAGWGSSNGYDETLTIVYRKGTFLVGGYDYGWELRDAIGTCSINFLSGKGAVQDGMGGPFKPIKGKFKPVPLKDWTPALRPQQCHDEVVRQRSRGD